jgi:hypothetical protein
VEIGNGALALDALVKAFICEHLTYRFDEAPMALSRGRSKSDPSAICRPVHPFSIRSEQGGRDDSGELPAFLSIPPRRRLLVPHGYAAICRF